MKKFINILIYIFIPFYLFSHKYSFKNYTNADGLPQAQVISITQDSIGRIWVSTHCGIAYYDGYEFKTINKKMGLPTNYVYNILFKDNKILGGGSFSLFEIDLYGKKEIKFLSLPYVVRDFCPLREKLFFATDEGFFVYKNNKIFKLLPFPPASGKNTIMEKNGVLFYLSKNSIYKVKEDGSWEKLLESNAGLCTINCFKDKFLIGGEDGLYQFEGKELVKYKDLPEVQDLLISKEDIWVATFNGLYLIQKDRVFPIGKEEGLPSNEIYCLFKDRENILWIGTDNGVSKLQSLGFENYVSEKGLFSASVWSFLEMEDGSVLIGGDKGFGIYKEGSVKEIDLKEINGSSIRSIARLKNKILLAVQNKGIYSLDMKRGFKLQRFIENKFQGIFEIFKDSQDNLWISTRNGLYRFSHNKIDYYNKEKGLPDDTIFKVLEDPLGRILALTDGGIAIYKNLRFEIPEEFKFLLGNSIRSMIFDKERIWIGTLGNGLFFFDGRKWENITEEKGLPSDNIWSMEKDDLGFMWIGTNKGIVMFAEGYSCLFNSNDGLKGDEVTLNGVLKTRDGKIWFGLTSGALMLDPYKIEPNLNPPEIYIEKLETEKRVIPAEGKVELSPSERRVSIYFNGLSFQDETEIYYSYRLNPIEDWSKPIQDRKVTYSNLKPGNYIFEVKACNASWIWNDNPFTLKIDKLPYFYEKASFKFILGSLFMFLVLLYFRKKTRAVREEKERLERIINDKTKELQERLKELYVLSTTDFLTKVYNRGHFEKLLKEEIKKAKKENKTIGLAILDLDHFKDLNDEFGHSMGDNVLVEFGKLLKNTFRTTDIVARYGGDEFVILFLSTEPEGCLSRLKDLMSRVKDIVYESEEKKIILSLSIGVVFVSFQEEKTIELEDFLKKADKALYEAKNKGRDTIIVYHL
ncbi:MAG: diguanylate cyclase [Thermoanaerobaculia bacterium]